MASSTEIPKYGGLFEDYLIKSIEHYLIMASMHLHNPAEAKSKSMRKVGDAAKVNF